MAEVEKPSALHEETPVHVISDSDSDADIKGFETDLDHLPPGYYRSPFFVGSFLAVGVSLACGTGAFGYAAPLLTQINADLGPDPMFIWVSLVYNVMLAIGLVLVGRLSDIFGRRYFFIGGQIIGVLGCVVCAKANSVPMLIGGNVLLGIATAPQLSFHFVVGELVPMKYRFFASAFLYLFPLPTSGFGPAISYAFQTRTAVGWRGTYWLLLALNGFALILWVVFYFPPSFHKLHRQDNDSKMYWVKHFDYIGTLLFAAGFVCFLLGLSWGGALYPWKSAAVITSIVGGFAVLVAFVLWECYAPLKEPLIPMSLFKDFRWVSACILLGLGAGVYYAFAIILPIQALVLYNDDGNLVKAGLIASIVGLGIISGQWVGGVLSEPIGKTKIQCIVVFTLGGIFFGACACITPDNRNTMIALIYCGCFFIGWNETICLANSTILVKDQKMIGCAGGVAGSMRAFICAILIAIYVTILTNRLTETISTQVPAAVIAAGLPASSVAQYIGAFSIGTPAAFQAVPGITTSILTVGARAYKEANADAFRTVYLSTIAFSGLAVILTFFAPNVDELMTANVAATLHNEDDKLTREKTQEYVEA